MALQVWLPLTRDLRNQGLSNIKVENHNATLNTAGKLGSCYYFNGSQQWLQFDTVLGNYYNNDWSIACWLKPTDSTRSIIISEYSSTGSSNVALELTTSRIVRLYWNGSPDINFTTAGALPINEWTHLTVTKQARVVKVFFNGELKQTYINGSDFSARTSASYPRIGDDYRGNSGNTVSYQGYINDFRMYDHCLSPMEIKKLSQGLILHYPLNRGGLGPSNLIKNGFGELGSENWDNNTNISTSDIPSGQSDIKASFGNGRAIEHIKLYPTHTYKFSAWIKATATSGNTYPSLFPYDVDGKFINNYNCPDGFNLNTMTTLKQQLKAGDTKIYVNDLSQWNANSGHYYNWAAIFSYTDGNGYTYPDGAYTQNMGRFGSSTTAKVNLDKTNNVITLLSAYTGPTMPVGTKVCASTEGSTYFYPWGGFNLANIQNWTYKESTVSGGHNRLRYAKYVTFWTYSNNRMAGIKIRDLTNEGMDSTTEYDTSGYCNNGTRMGVFSWTSDTPKYSVSTQFNSTSTKIQLPVMDFSGMANSYTFAWWQYNASTGNMPWGFSNGNRLNCYHCSPLCWNTGDGSSNQFKNGSDTVAPTTVQNGWHHIVVTGDGTATKLYIDGVYKGTATTYKSLTGTQIWISGWDSGTSYTFNGSKECDFRIYATALSASDVKSLYQNCATIDPDGTIHGQIRS